MEILSQSQAKSKVKLVSPQIPVDPSLPMVYHMPVDPIFSTELKAGQFSNVFASLFKFTTSIKILPGWWRAEQSQNIELFDC